jgi:hypothetical protein
MMTPEGTVVMPVEIFSPTAFSRVVFEIDLRSIALISILHQYNFLSICDTVLVSYQEQLIEYRRGRSRS